jgi:hypothetical protein
MGLWSAVTIPLVEFCQELLDSFFKARLGLQEVYFVMIKQLLQKAVIDGQI